MAGKRHNTTGKSIARPRSHRAPSHAEKLTFIRRYGKPAADPTNERAVTRQYNKLKQYPFELERKADSKTREALKERGFFTTKRGVIVDGPRDSKRQPIKGAKLTISKDGTVKWSVKQRRDYVVGLTKKERREFAKNPEAVIARKEQELRERFPSVGKRRKIQTRLQWGAYQATKDFSPRVFTAKYFAKFLPREQEHKMDKLTGLHFTVHVPRTKPKGKRYGKRRRS